MMRQFSPFTSPMRFFGYAALSAYSLFTSCNEETRQEPEPQILVEDGITYIQSDEGFSLSSDMIQGFNFTYTQANQTCMYENNENPANKRIYTDNECDGTIDSTLWVDCSNPDSCVFLDIEPESQQRDIEALVEVRERLRVEHYRSVWQESSKFR